MDPDTDVCQTEQPQISYSVDFTAEQSSTMPLDQIHVNIKLDAEIPKSIGSGGVKSKEVPG